MSALLSQSAIKRLPVAIKKLTEKEQAVFVHLRMRRDETMIAREVGASLPETREMIHVVQDTLVRMGALDMIRNPVFYPIDNPGLDDDDGHGTIQLKSGDMDIADQVELEQFYRTLAKSLTQVPKEGRRLLDLWFNKEMKAKDILNFYKNLGLALSSNKSINETREQDVFYQLEKNIQKLTAIVRSNMNDDAKGLTPSVLRSILDETGV